MVDGHHPLLHSKEEAMRTQFGQLLKEKRIKAGLSVAELAMLSYLPAARIEAIENGVEIQIRCDEVYNLSQAISRRSEQRFVMTDLWDALRMDVKATSGRGSNNQAA